MAGRDEVADVVIVGSGATGAIAAMVLGQAGLNVVCLEQGGWIEDRDHPHYHGDWQWQRKHRWSPDVNVRKNNADDFPVRSDSSQVLMWNGVGGSTNVYSALWPRYRPVRLPQRDGARPRPRLADRLRGPRPLLRAADRLIGVSGLAGDPSMPPQDDVPDAARAAGRSTAAVSREAFDRLGWHWWPVPAGVISRDYDGRPACNGCGICNGCPRGSMSKYALSVWPKALDAGVDLRTYARVVRVETGPRRPRHRRRLCRPQHRPPPLPKRRGRHPRRQRRRHAPPPARLRPRQRVGPGRPQPDAPHAHRLRDVGRRAARLAHRLRRVAHQPRVRRDRHRAAASSTASTSTASPPAVPASRRAASSPSPRPLGQGPPRLVRAPFRPRLRRVRDRRRPAATPTTASRSPTPSATRTASRSPSCTTARARTTGG